MVRAKFVCDSIQGGVVKFRAVYEPDAEKNPEDARFTQATPWGTIEMAIDNSAALKEIYQGGVFYVDFTEACPEGIPAV